MGEQKNDWISILVNVPNASYDMYAASGINEKNTTIDSRESYKEAKKIKEMFTDKQSGQFDEEKYNKFYDYALESYNKLMAGTYSDGEYVIDKPIVPKEVLRFTKHPERYQAANERPTIRFIENPFSEPGQTFGLSSINTMSERQLSDREVAQKQFIFDKKSNKFLDYTPNTMAGILSVGYALGEPIVLAQYDQDTTEYDQDSGQYVKHYKGELKKNEFGKPYYETLLQGESVVGKQPLHVTDILTEDGSWVNKIDIFDADGVDKSVFGSAARLVVDLALLFNKRTRPFIVVPHAAMTFADSGSQLIRSITSDDALLSQNKAYNGATWLQNHMLKFETTTTDYAQQNPFSVEQFANMFVDIPLQLFEQRYVAKIPGLFRGSEAMARQNAAIRQLAGRYKSETGRILRRDLLNGKLDQRYSQYFADLTSAAEFKQLQMLSKTGATISKGYMALMQADEVSKIMEEHGIDANTRAFGQIAAASAFFALFMGTSLGDVALAGLGYSELKTIGKDIAELFVKKANGLKPGLIVTEGNQMLTKNKSILRSFYDGASDVIQKAIKKPMIADAVRESIEEVSEEAINDIVIGASRKLRDTFKWGDPTNDTYKWSESDVATRYIMSFIGGAIGGSFFHAANKISSKISGVPQKTMSEDTMRTLLYAITNGRTQDVIKQLDDLLANGKTGVSTSLTFDFDKTDAEGNPIYKPVSQPSDKSQAQQIIEMAKAIVFGYDSIINQDGYKIPNKDVYLNVVAKNRRMMQLLEQGIDVEILQDFQNQLYEYYRKRGEYNNMSDEDKQSVDGQVKAGQIKLAKENLDALLAGNKSDYYARKAAFYLNYGINHAFFDANQNAYARSLGIKITDKNASAIAKSYQTTYDLEKEHQGTLSSWIFASGENRKGYFVGNASTFWKNLAWDNFNTVYNATKDKIQNYVGSLDMVAKTQMAKTIETTNKVLNNFVANQEDDTVLTQDEIKQIIDNKLKSIGKTREELLADSHVNWQHLSLDKQNELLVQAIDRVKKPGEYSFTEEIQAQALYKSITLAISNESTGEATTKSGLNPNISMRTTGTLVHLLNQILDEIEKIKGENPNVYIDSTTLDILKSILNAKFNVTEDVINIIDQLDTFEIQNLINKAMDGIDIKLDNTEYPTKLNDVVFSSQRQYEMQDGQYVVLETNTSEELTKENIRNILKDSSSKEYVKFENEDGTTTEGFRIYIEGSNDEYIVLKGYKKGVLTYYNEGDEDGEIVVSWNLEEGYINKLQEIKDEIIKPSIQQTLNNVTSLNKLMESNDPYVQFIADEIIVPYLSKIEDGVRPDLMHQISTLGQSGMQDIYSALNDFSKELTGSSSGLFDILREQSQIFENGKFKGFSFINESLSSQIETAAIVLDMYISILNSLEKNSDYEDIANPGFISIIQEAEKKRDGSIKTVGIDLISSSILKRDIETVRQKIQQLLLLDRINNKTKISKSQETRQRQQLNDLAILTGRSQKWAKLSDLHIPIDDKEIAPFDFTGILKEEQLELIDKTNGITGSKEDIKAIELASKRLKHELYERVKGLTYQQRQAFVKLIISSVDGELNFDDNSPQTIDENITAENLSDLYVLNNILSWMSYDVYKFNADLKTYLNANEDAKAPFYDQMVAIYQIVAKSQQNSFHDALCDVLQKDMDDIRDSGKPGVYLGVEAKHWNAPKGVSVLCGDSGSGKTQVVLGVVSGILNQDAQDKVSVAPTKKRANELNTHIKAEKVYSRDELLSQLFKDETLPECLTVKGLQEEIGKNSSELLSNNSRINKEQLNKTSQLKEELPFKYVYIDEYTGFSVFDIQLLNDLGIKVYMAGDRKQPGFDQQIQGCVPYGQMLYTPELICNVRSENNLQFENTNIMANIIRQAHNLEISNESPDDIEAYIQSAISLHSLKYFERKNSDGGVDLFGTKVVESIDEQYIEGLTKTLREGESVCIITDDISKYQSIKNSFGDQIVVVDINNVQGDEYQYVIVDASKPVELNYSLFGDQLAYMLAGRAKSGTIFIGDQRLGSFADMNRLEEPNVQQMQLSNKQLGDYKNLFLDLLDTNVPSVNVDQAIVESDEQEDEPQSQPVTVEPISEMRELTPEEKAQKVMVFPFYKHFGVFLGKTATYVSSTREDLSLPNNDKYIQWLIQESENIQSNNADIVKQLAALRSFVFCKMANKPVNDKQFDAYMNPLSKGENEDSFDIYDVIGIETKQAGDGKIISKSKQLFDALGKGSFKIKVTKNSFSDKNYGIDHVGFDQKRPSGNFWRFVYHIDVDGVEGGYDITVGVVSNEDQMKEKLRIDSSTDVLEGVDSGVKYFDIGNKTAFTIKGIETLKQDKTHDATKQLIEIPFSEYQAMNPEFKFTKVLLPDFGQDIGAIKDESNKSETLGLTRGAPVVFVSFNVFDDANTIPKQFASQKRSSESVPTTQLLYVRRKGYTIRQLIDMCSRQDEDGSTQIDVKSMLRMLPDMLPSKLIISLSEHANYVIQNRPSHDDYQTAQEIRNWLDRLFKDKTENPFLKQSIELTQTTDIENAIITIENNPLFKRLNATGVVFEDKFMPAWNKIMQFIKTRKIDDKGVARVNAIIRQIQGYELGNGNSQLDEIYTDLQKLIQEGEFEQDYNVSNLCDDILQIIDDLNAKLNSQQGIDKLFASKLADDLISSGSVFHINKKGTILNMIFKYYSNGDSNVKKFFDHAVGYYNGQWPYQRKELSEDVTGNRFFPYGIFVECRDGVDSIETDEGNYYEDYSDLDHIYASAFVQLPRFTFDVENVVITEEKSPVGTSTTEGSIDVQEDEDDNGFKIDNFINKSFKDTFESIGVDYNDIVNDVDAKDSQLLNKLREKAQNLLTSNLVKATKVDSGSIYIPFVIIEGSELSIDKKSINFDPELYSIEQETIESMEISSGVDGNLSGSIQTNAGTYTIDGGNVVSFFDSSQDKTSTEEGSQDNLWAEVEGLVDQITDGLLKGILKNSIGKVEDMQKALDDADGMFTTEVLKENAEVLNQIYQKINC